MMGILWENSLGVFVFFTLILGGGAAWMTGRAVARSWEPWWHAALWVVPLAAFIQFLQFALHGNTLLSAHYYLVNLGCLVAIAALGYRVTRTRIVTRQYNWLFVSSSPFSWRPRTAGSPAPGAGADTTGDA